VTRLIPEQTILDAYAFYRAEPCRTLEQAAGEFGIHRRTLARKVAQMGLASKSQRERRVGVSREATRQQRRLLKTEARKTSYTRVVEPYRAGKKLEAIGKKTGLDLAMIRELLQAAGETCPRCEVLLRETEPYGVAVLASGERLCQWCGEVEPGGVARWEREPVEVVTDYAEIANVYAWEGER